MYKRGPLYLRVWAATGIYADKEPVVGIVLPTDRYVNSKEPEAQPDNLEVIYMPLDVAKAFLVDFEDALERSIIQTWEKDKE